MNLIKPIPTDSFALYARASTGTYWDRAKVMQTATTSAPRINWNPATGAFEGVLVEPTRTNLLLNSASLSTQTRAVAPGTQYTLSFYGTGTITLSGAAASSVVGTGTYARSVLTFSAAGGTLTLTVSGSVQYANLEAGAWATSWIPTTGSTATRAADVVTGTGLFQSTFPQPVAAYNPATTYATGNTVAVGARLYESLTDGNVGNDPTTPSTPPLWLDVGATNPFACFDQTVSVPSTGPGPLQVFATKLPTAATAVAFVGVSATRVHVAIAAENSGVITTLQADVASYAGAVVLRGVLPGNIISIATENTSGDVVLGEIVIGSWHELGATRYGHSFSITDYSRKETDEFGVTSFLERAFAKRMTASLVVQKADYNGVITLLESIRAKPTVWIATPDVAYSAGAIVYGNYADFSIDISYPTENLCALEIQGLI